MQTSASTQFTRLERDGPIAIVTMARPEKRNALSLDMMEELNAVFGRLGGSSDVAVAILRGEGAAFSAGHDLRELGCSDAASAERIFDVCVELMTTIQTIRQPVIAEVATVATAAGCQLVATCDLAVASTEATFATPGVRIGLFCSTPMVALTRAVGRKRAMEMLLTGDFIDARTAAEWGLVNHVVPPEQLHEAALNLAVRIARASRTIVALGKAAFYRQIDLDQAQAYAAMKRLMTDNTLEPDAQEGIAAFLERRPARWHE